MQQRPSYTPLLFLACGYSLEPPQLRQNRKNIYPCKPQFYYIEVGCKGVYFTQTCNHDANKMACAFSKATYHPLYSDQSLLMHVRTVRSNHMGRLSTVILYEPRHEKTCYLHLRKQRRRSALR